MYIQKNAEKRSLLQDEANLETHLPIWLSTKEFHTVPSKPTLSTHQQITVLK